MQAINYGILIHSSSKLQNYVFRIAQCILRNCFEIDIVTPLLSLININILINNINTRLSDQVLVSLAFNYFPLTLWI